MAHVGPCHGCRLAGCCLQHCLLGFLLNQLLLLLHQQQPLFKLLSTCSSRTGARYKTAGIVLRQNRQWHVAVTWCASKQTVQPALHHLAAMLQCCNATMARDIHFRVNVTKAMLTASGCGHLQPDILDDLLRQRQQRLLHATQLVSSTGTTSSHVRCRCRQCEGARQQQQTRGQAAVERQLQPVLIVTGGRKQSAVSAM